MLDWIRRLERQVWALTNKHPAWNVITWAGHGLAVAAITGLAALLSLLPSLELTAIGATAAAGFYLFGELEEIYRGRHATVPARFWAWLDHAMDAAVPIAVAWWLA
jgi:hypothetical protein